MSIHPLFQKYGWSQSDAALSITPIQAALVKEDSANLRAGTTLTVFDHFGQTPQLTVQISPEGTEYVLKAFARSYLQHGGTAEDLQSLITKIVSQTEIQKTP